MRRMLLYADEILIYSTDFFLIPESFLRFLQVSKTETGSEREAMQLHVDKKQKRIKICIYLNDTNGLKSWMMTQLFHCPQPPVQAVTRCPVNQQFHAITVWSEAKVQWEPAAEVWSQWKYKGLSSRKNTKQRDKAM